jgi:hypothetical protein
VTDIDIDEIVDELRGRVARRRASGDYPPGLEQQLEAEFALIMAGVHRPEVDTGELGRRVAAVEQLTAGVRAETATSSRVPGGSIVHATAQRLVVRQTGELAETVRALGRGIAEALHELHHLVDVQRQADERQLGDVVNALMDRVAIIDHVADAVVQLETRLARLEAHEPRS